MSFALLALAIISVGACSTNTGPKEVGGTTAGSGAVASAGATTGNRAAGTTASAALGGFLGNRIGAALDDDDKRRAYAAQMQALDTGPSGAPVAWRNPDSGRYGNVVPGPVYQMNGAPCRQYTHTVYIDGQPQTERGTACRDPDGTWNTIS
ncbi:MAG TPA: RT0821/Lpp0805 family surface protein [Xanthobacteraceae bacterium]|nr:RT0821/Lpp0805 family surface protein [Xanthobacteraceae bacterium]